MDPRVARSHRKLLAAATQLLVEAGPAAVTVDAVVERSGVAKSTLYRHWASRGELLLDVMRAHLPCIDDPDLSLGFEAALRVQLAAVADAFVDPEWACILPALIALQRHEPELTELFAADRRAHLDVLASVLDLGVAEGHLPPGIDVQLAADLLIGPLVLATIDGDLTRVRDLAGHSAERFIASYAGWDSAPAKPGPAPGPASGQAGPPATQRTRRPRRNP